jgi:ferredoxin
MVLEGLREVDVPTEGDGFRTVYNLLTPDYRTEFDTAEGFADHFRTPFMSMLLGHESADRGVLDVNDDVTEATQQVEITAEDGEPYRYEFTLVEQQTGRFEDCWLVEGLTLVMDDSEEFRHLPTVEYDGQEIKCEPGDRLRDVIRQVEGLSPHNGATDRLNCGANGLCGTCAVEVVDAADSDRVSDRTGGERRRLSLPPFRGSDVPDLRLSCKTEVYDDLRVRKHDGRMGQKRAGTDDHWIEGFLDGELVRVEKPCTHQ